MRSRPYTVSYIGHVSTTRVHLRCSYDDAVAFEHGSEFLEECIEGCTACTSDAAAQFMSQEK